MITDRDQAGILGCSILAVYVSALALAVCTAYLQDIVSAAGRDGFILLQCLDL